MKKNKFGTTEINSVFSYISDLSRDLAEMKNGTFQNLIEKSRLVPQGGTNSNHFLG